MKRKLTIIIIFLITCPIIIKADDEQSTFPYISVSTSGKYYFKMIPGQNDYYNHDTGTGAMCTLSRDGKETVLWTVTGWYSFRTYPSYDGECLVRLGNWPRGKGPSKDHLAVAFYKKGLLLKRYSTIDLIKDMSKVYPSVSHYEYLCGRSGFDGFNYLFSLITIDKIQYQFDVRTGDIVSIKLLKVNCGLED